MTSRYMVADKIICLFSPDRVQCFRKSFFKKEGRSMRENRSRPFPRTQLNVVWANVVRNNGNNTNFGRSRLLKYGRFIVIMIGCVEHLRVGQSQVYEDAISCWRRLSAPHSVLCSLRENERFSTNIEWGPGVHKRDQRGTTTWEQWLSWWKRC